MQLIPDSINHFKTHHERSTKHLLDDNRWCKCDFYVKRDINDATIWVTPIAITLITRKTLAYAILRKQLLVLILDITNLLRLMSRLNLKYRFWLITFPNNSNWHFTVYFSWMTLNVFACRAPLLTRSLSISDVGFKPTLLFFA